MSWVDEEKRSNALEVHAVALTERRLLTRIERRPLLDLLKECAFFWSQGMRNGNPYRYVEVFRFSICRRKPFAAQAKLKKG